MKKISGLSGSVSWLGYYAVVLQNVTTGREWTKYTKDLFALFLKIASESTIIWKKSVKKGLTKVNKGIIETKKDVCHTEITMGVSNNKLAALRHQNSEVIKV